MMAGRKKVTKYYSEDVNGNLHDVARYMNERHPDADLIAAHVEDHYTVIIYRVTTIIYRGE